MEQTNPQTRQITKKKYQKSPVHHSCTTSAPQRGHFSIAVFCWHVPKNHQEICAELQPQKFKVHSNGQASVVWLFVVGNSTRETKKTTTTFGPEGNFWNGIRLRLVVSGFSHYLQVSFVHHILFIQDFCSS